MSDKLLPIQGKPVHRERVALGVISLGHSLDPASYQHFSVSSFSDDEE